MLSHTFNSFINFSDFMRPSEYCHIRALGDIFNTDNRNWKVQNKDTMRWYGDSALDLYSGDGQFES